MLRGAWWSIAMPRLCEAIINGKNPRLVANTVLRTGYSVPSALDEAPTLYLHTS
jgi:hypothetical protein